MDQVMVDISNLDGVDIGSEVLIYGSHGGHVLRPEDVAKQAGTIPYELLVRIGKRVHRIFLEP
jgi:alanine racemase